MASVEGGLDEETRRKNNDGRTWEDTYLEGLTDYVKHVHLGHTTYMHDPFIFACFETAVRGMSAWIESRRESIEKAGPILGPDMFIAHMTTVMFYSSDEMSKLGETLRDATVEDGALGTRWYDAIMIVTRLATK